MGFYLSSPIFFPKVLRFMNNFQLIRSGILVPLRFRRDSDDWSVEEEGMDIGLLVPLYT